MNLMKGSTIGIGYESNYSKCLCFRGRFNEVNSDRGCMIQVVEQSSSFWFCL